MKTITKRRKAPKTHLNLRSFRRVLKLIVDSEKYVAKHPEAEPLFNYSMWTYGDKLIGHTPKYIVAHPCGTQCCLGGWGNVLRNADENKRRVQTNEVAAAEFFGMTFLLEYDSAKYLDTISAIGDWTDNEAQYLFYGYWHADALSASTKDVIAKLQNIIKTGKVVNYSFDKKYLSRKEK